MNLSKKKISFNSRHKNKVSEGVEPPLAESESAVIAVIIGIKKSQL
jgi:hypothetical protein